MSLSMLPKLHLLHTLAILVSTKFLHLLPTLIWHGRPLTILQLSVKIKKAMVLEISQALDLIQLSSCPFRVPGITETALGLIGPVLL